MFVGAVERTQMPVDADLVEGIAADQRLGDLAIDGCHRLAHPFAGEPRLVAVAQLDRLAAAGGGARWHCSTAACATLQNDIDLDGRVAAAVEDLAAADTAMDRMSLMLGPPGSRAIRSRLVVVPATPNGMPAAMAMISPGPGVALGGRGRAGVLDDLRQLLGRGRLDG